MSPGRDTHCTARGKGGRLRRLGFLCVAALALTVAAPAVAQWRLFESEFDEKPWAEIETKLPAAPRPADLIRFDAGSGTPHRYFIDAASLSVGEDRVVRYTLVIRTAGGATNVTFEGMRCETSEQKQYAIGHADGKWTRARDPQWRRIDRNNEYDRHHNALYGEFFCPERHIRMVSVKQMLAALRQSAASLR